MRPHPTIRLLLIAFLTFVLCAPGIAGAGPAPATLTPSLYFLFHPQFIKNNAGASSTLHLQNPSNYNPATVVLEFYSESGVLKARRDFTIARHSVLRIGGEDVPALENGTYTLVVVSDEQVESVVRTLEIGVPEKLVAYRGQSTETTILHFGPVYKKTAGLNSSIRILNTSYVNLQVTVRYLSNAGVEFGTQTITLFPYEVGTFANTLLPEGFEGWASITSTGNMVGILLLSDSPANTVREARGPLGTEAVTASAPRALQHLDQGTGPRSATLLLGNTQADSPHAEVAFPSAGSAVAGQLFIACVPRVLKHSDQGTGPRSTTLFAGNTQTVSAYAEVTFYDAGGGVVLTDDLSTLPAEGAKNIRLADLADLPAGAWGACVFADQMLVIDELTTLDSAGSANETTYDAPLTADLGQPYGVVLPSLVKDETAHTVFTVQNTGTTSGAATVRLYNLTGSLVYQDTVTLASLGWKAYDLSQIPELSAGFAGSGEVASAVPLIGIVDEFARPLIAPAAITDLEASKDDGKVKLDWTEVEFDTFSQSITDPTYNVYRAQDTPYFLPAAADASYAPGLTSPTLTDSDATVLTDATHSTYYVVKAVYQGLRSGSSNRVGVFLFGLVPGS